jgi:hypothetical protein
MLRTDEMLNRAGSFPKENLSNLPELCVFWQKVLRLQDWDVKLAVVRFHELEDGNLFGQSSWIISKRYAAIKILDCRDYHLGHWWDRDQEETLVHELLHLHLAPLKAASNWRDGSLEMYALENVIETIASSLLFLKRAGRLDELELSSFWPPVEVTANVSGK